jgi:hypothetical protein
VIAIKKHSWFISIKSPQKRWCKESTGTEKQMYNSLSQQGREKEKSVED